ncbi:hypothetical protein [Massilia sp. erpn]|uniref:hypothetical protein n=1 Tax=Massilia sp. erpn TaxID=2738142 RepID=UPI0021040686|nr:hypothetical protein [Massilia sp. erpn]UTY57707.1 hypothetical protein HPQ68_11250 [Massilia sp. erpn]
MSKHIKPEIAALFATLGFTPVDPSAVMTNWWPDTPAPEDEIPATFYHAGIDAYFAYAPFIIDGMWDGVLQTLGAIAVVDDDISAEDWKSVSDLPLELIIAKDLPEFLAHRAFNPTYFDLRIAKRCVAHAQQELIDLDGDECPTREQYRNARKAWKEAVKHLRNLVVPRFQSIKSYLLPALSVGMQTTRHSPAL